MMDEFARLFQSSLAQPTLKSSPPGGADQGTHSPAFVGRVFAQTAVPTSVNRFFLVHPVAVLGSEQEGGAGSLVVETTTTVAVFVVGQQAPVVGDDLICHFVSHRWVAEGRTKSQSQSQTATIPGCLCQAIPTVLQMMPNNPTLNGGMFQPCTLGYGDTPPDYSQLALGAKCFLSTASFIDQLGESYRYYFTCTTNKFTLTRVYAHSIFGSPFRDIVRYTWPLTVSGNTCSPFLLSSGQVYQGGDTRSQIVVSE